MQIRQNQQFAGQTLRHCPGLFRACWGVVWLGGMLWLLELFAAVLLLRLRGIPAAALLTEQAVLWRLIQLCWLVPAWLCRNWCSWSLWVRCTAAISLLPGGKAPGMGRCFGTALCCTLLRTISLQPAALCLFGAYALAKTGAAHAESAPYLFAAVQLLLLGTLCLLGWVYVCLGLWCAPFVCFACPELSVWHIPFAALKIMRGGRKELLALLGWYAVQMLPLVTIPWLLPRAVLSVTIFCNIRVAGTQQTAHTGRCPDMRRLQ